VSVVGPQRARQAALNRQPIENPRDRQAPERPRWHRKNAPSIGGATLSRSVVTYRCYRSVRLGVNVNQLRRSLAQARRERPMTVVVRAC
jgi:hypothetical protein